MAQVLKNDLEYDNVCVVHGDDDYNKNLAMAFENAALDPTLDIEVVKSIETYEKPSEKQAADAINILKDATCRVVFFSLHPSSAVPIMRQASAAGIMGPESGWLWVVPDAITVGVEDIKTSMQESVEYCDAGGEVDDCDKDFVITTEGAPADLLVGMMGFLPLSPSGDARDTFLASYNALPNTVGR